MACALSAGAQGIYQFADPGFESPESEWTSIEVKGLFSTTYYKEPGKGWHSFASATGGMFSLGVGMSPHPELVTDSHSGIYAVCLKSKKTAGKIYANGNLTTGRIMMGNMTPNTPSDNYNYSEIIKAEDSKTDNFLEFAGTPDAVTFYAKFKPGTPIDDNTPLQGRGKFILHDNSAYQDPETDADGNIKEVNKGHRIALAEQLITNQDWTKYTAEFKYDERTSAPTKQYLLASFTTNPIPGGSYGDELYIDDVYFVYYSDLKSLSYDGTPINIEDPKNIQIAAKDFDLSKVSCTSGKGADIQTSYNEGTRILTITIEGNDISVNSENHHEYSVKIVPPASEVTLTDDRLIKVNMMETVYPSINSVTISESESKDGTVAFTMKNFTFAGAISVGDVTLTGATLSYADNGSINITAPEQELSLLGGAIYTKVSLNGNVAVVNGKKELTADVNINWYSGYPTDMSTIIPIKVAVSAIPFNTTLEGKTLKVTGSVAADEAAAVIPTDANAPADAPVKVDVNVVDLTEAALTGEITSSAFAAKNPNTLFYAAEEATLTGDNVVKGTECDNFVLTDGQSFNAPEGFTANQITYKRATAASTDEKDEVYTFVLPFTFTADKVNGTVYELSGVNDGVLDFTSLEGSMELKANRPYLVVSNGTQLLNASAFSGEVVATGDLTNEVYGGVTMEGAYEATEVKSEGNENWYGYNAKGEFVKATTGTINPFRAAIKSTGSQSSFALKLDGTVTGILNLENPNAKVDVYTISGVCVRKNVPAASALNGLSRGVYIVGGQKVVK